MAPLVTVLITGGVTLALIALFRYEAARGARCLPITRRALDHAVENAGGILSRRWRQITGPAMRQSLHYIFHQLLTGIIRLLQRLEVFVYTIVHLNRDRAKRRRNASSSSLSGIVEHKRAAGLSEEEKQRRRDEALNGH